MSETRLTAVIKDIACRLSEIEIMTKACCCWNSRLRARVFLGEKRKDICNGGMRSKINADREHMACQLRENNFH
jgi:hypothetical protein